MKIDHVAIWAKDIERMCGFYQKYFGGTVHPEYHNPTKGFTSRFITFESGARIEVMHRGDIQPSTSCEHFGWAHLAISVGSKEKVDELTRQMNTDGVTIIRAPRTTGDGYYESVAQDPEGNLVELTP